MTIQYKTAEDGHSHVYYQPEGWNAFYYIEYDANGKEVQYAMVLDPTGEKFEQFRSI